MNQLDSLALMATNSRFHLVWKDKDLTRIFPLLEGSNDIGAVSSNDLVLADVNVSRRHAVLTVEGPGVSLRDLDSKNGTFVNGARASSQDLAIGDQIAIGSVALRLEVSDDQVGLAFTVARTERTGPSAELETEPASSSGDRAGQGLTILSAFLGAIHGGGGRRLSDGLGELARHLGAQGVALLEGPVHGELAVRAAWGQLAAEASTVLHRFAKLETGRRGFLAGHTADGEAPVSYGLLEDDDRVQALLVSGVAEGGMERLFEVILTMIALMQPPGEPRGPRGPREARHGERLGSALVFPPGHVVGRSAAILSMYHELETVCRADFPVLLLGETGVGKEHVAKTIHLSSRRRGGPFVAVNCAAIPAELLEAELFGIRKGVATGVAERRGRFELAEGGTLLLDEIGDLSLELQVKLLRVLESGEVQPLGGSPKAMDLRIVAATHVDLLRRVEDGGFRRDLYYRLAGYVLRIPALRQRRDDVAGLVEHFTAESVAESGRQVRGVTLRAVEALAAYGWPGNVRELAHEVRRLVYSCLDGEAIDLPLLSEPVRLPAVSEHCGGHGGPEESLDLASRTAALERRLIMTALEDAGTNRSQAARLLGISRQGLGLKIKRLGISDRLDR